MKAKCAHLFPTLTSLTSHLVMVGISTPWKSATTRHRRSPPLPFSQEPVVENYQHTTGWMHLQIIYIFSHFYYQNFNSFTNLFLLHHFYNIILVYSSFSYLVSQPPLLLCFCCLTEASAQGRLCSFVLSLYPFPLI